MNTQKGAPVPFQHSDVWPHGPDGLPNVPRDISASTAEEMDDRFLVDETPADTLVPKNTSHTLSPDTHSVDGTAHSQEADPMADFDTLRSALHNKRGDGNSMLTFEESTMQRPLQEHGIHTVPLEAPSKKHWVKRLLERFLTVSNNTSIDRKGKSGLEELTLTNDPNARTIPNLTHEDREYLWAAINASLHVPKPTPQAPVDAFTTIRTPTNKMKDIPQKFLDMHKDLIQTYKKAADLARATITYNLEMIRRLAVKDTPESLAMIKNYEAKNAELIEKIKADEQQLYTIINNQVVIEKIRKIEAEMPEVQEGFNVFNALGREEFLREGGIERAIADTTNAEQGAEGPRRKESESIPA